MNQETGVSAARAGTADIGFEQHHVEGGLVLLEIDRRPQTGETAADDTDVGPDIALEDRRWVAGLGGHSVFKPMALVHRRSPYAVTAPANLANKSL